MGEAKRRGTFEERRAAAIMRDMEATEKRQKIERARRAERLAAMTQEERRRQRIAKLTLAQFLGVVAAFGSLDRVPFEALERQDDC